jgi:hypothetical protein
MFDEMYRLQEHETGLEWCAYGSDWELAAYAHDDSVWVYVFRYARSGAFGASCVVRWASSSSREDAISRAKRIRDVVVCL